MFSQYSKLFTGFYDGCMQCSVEIRTKIWDEFQTPFKHRLWSYCWYWSFSPLIVSCNRCQAQWTSKTLASTLRLTSLEVSSTALLAVAWRLAWKYCSILALPVAQSLLFEEWKQVVVHPLVYMCNEHWHANIVSHSISIFPTAVWWGCSIL